MAKSRILLSQLFLCFFFGVSSINGKPPSAIVGGMDADENEFPYQVSLNIFGQSTCGGTIIGPKHILTAAHCVNKKEFNYTENMEVMTGTNDINDGQGKSYKIKSIMKHPEYSPPQAWKNDIAVISLRTEIEFNSRERAAKLPTNDTSDNVVAIASGWGDTFYPNGYAPAKLKKLTMITVLNSNCSLPTTGMVHDSQLCALDKKGAGLCLGDSGGPLAHDGVVIGIASFVMRCGLGYPDVFTRVYKYVDWINEVMDSS